MLADTQILQARARIDQNTYETALHHVESQAAHTIETLRSVDRLEDLETALQLLRTALAEHRSLDAASDSLRLARTDMHRRIKTAAAAAAARADSYRTAFDTIVPLTLAGTLLTVGVVQ